MEQGHDYVRDVIFRIRPGTQKYVYTIKATAARRTPVQGDYTEWQMARNNRKQQYVVFKLVVLANFTHYSRFVEKVQSDQRIQLFCTISISEV